MKNLHIRLGSDRSFLHILCKCIGFRFVCIINIRRGLGYKFRWLIGSLLRSWCILYYFFISILEIWCLSILLCQDLRISQHCIFCILLLCHIIDSRLSLKTGRHKVHYFLRNYVHRLSIMFLTYRHCILRCNLDCHIDLNIKFVHFYRFVSLQILSKQAPILWWSPKIFY